MMVTLCREDLLNALLTARASGTRSSCSGQPGQRDSLSQAWPEKQFGHQFVHNLDAADVQLALSPDRELLCVLTPLGRLCVFS